MPDYKHGCNRAFLILVQTEPEVIGITYAKSTYCSCYNMYQSRCHERMVEQIFTNYRCTRSVEVDSRDV